MYSLVPEHEKNARYSFDKYDAYLLSSVLTESISTILLDRTRINNLYYIPSIIGYTVSFYIFPKSLGKYSIGIAYTIWCCIGIITTSTYDMIINHTIFTFKKFIGFVVILCGMLISSIV